MTSVYSAYYEMLNHDESSELLEEGSNVLKETYRTYI